MRWISFILFIQILAASLLPQMDFAELSKLPSLINHYQLHQTEKNYKGSFLDFLSLHYGEKNEDGHDHSHLPFKNCHHSFDYTFVAIRLVWASTETILEKNNKNTSLYKPSFYSNYFHEILQPPKLS
jgi:hypothetical protein